VLIATGQASKLAALERYCTYAGRTISHKIKNTKRGKQIPQRRQCTGLGSTVRLGHVGPEIPDALRIFG